MRYRRLTGPLFGHPFQRTGSRARSLRIEPLEHRCLLSASLQGELRSAIVENVSPGDIVELDVAVTNHGDEAANPGVVYFYWNMHRADYSEQSRIGEDSYGLLAPDETSDVHLSHTVPESTSGGEYYLSYWVDATDTTAEGQDGTGESDNMAAYAILVSPTVDAGGPYVGVEGQSVTLTASTTDPTFGDAAVYEWDLDFDGTFAMDATGQSVTHTWSDDWQGDVAVRVTGDDGSQGIDVAQVVIENRDPTVDFWVTRQHGSEGQPVKFPAGPIIVSDAPADRSELTAVWDFGDGATSSLATPTHTYADDGVYTVRLTIYDDDGGEGWAEITTTIDNLPPVPDAGRDRTVLTGSEVLFSGSAIDPGVNDVLQYRWLFSDDQTGAEGQDAAHVFIEPGVYTVTLSVEDELVAVSDTLTVTVIDVPHPGDADLDGSTSLSDFNIWNANKFTLDTDWTMGDFDGDERTDLSDFNIWNANKFTSSATPPPLTSDRGVVSREGNAQLAETAWLAHVDSQRHDSDPSSTGHSAVKVVDKLLASYWP